MDFVLKTSKCLAIYQISFKIFNSYKNKKEKNKILKKQKIKINKNKKVAMAYK